LRTRLKKVFTEEHHQKLLSDLDEDGIGRFARTCYEGVHLATPVFDGAKETDIKALLALAEQSSNGGLRVEKAGPLGLRGHSTVSSLHLVTPLPMEIPAALALLGISVIITTSYSPNANHALSIFPPNFSMAALTASMRSCGCAIRDPQASDA